MQIKIKTTTDWERWRAATFYDKEPETIAWIKGFEGGMFWDIGANIGVFSLWCAHKHPEMVIHAFEPMQVNLLRLWENIFLNDHIRTTAHREALDYVGGGHRMFRVPRAEVGASGGQVDRYMAGAVAEYMVPVVCGDDLVDTIGQPDYIKIDTDGNEYEILCGMPAVMANPQLKSVLVEINDRSDEIHDLMATAGLVPDDGYNSMKTRKSDFNVIFRREVTNDRRKSTESLS